MIDSSLSLQPGVNHFGEYLRASKFGHKMTRDLYAYPNRKPKERLNRKYISDEAWNSLAWAHRDADYSEHSDAFLLVQRDQALVNFDLAMRYFAALDTGEFEDALQRILEKGRTFQAVQSLKDWQGVSGVYVLVFDEYRQFYVGKANDIRKRVRDHWVSRKPFDRLLFGSHYESVFPVDELRALDTTRIYAARSKNPFGLEERVEKVGDPRFSLNRTWGGEPSTLQLVSPRRHRYLVDVTPISLAEFKHCREQLRTLLAQARQSKTVGVANLLAEVDLRVFEVECTDRSSFLWSRRDEIARWAAHGTLDLLEYGNFVSKVGHNVLWPAE